jgi:hypothetical protein
LRFLELSRPGKTLDEKSEESMKRLATMLVAAGALAFALAVIAPDEASAGWRRWGYYGYGYPGYGYAYPRWRGYGYGYGPYAYGYRPYAYYPYWRGRYWRRGWGY